MRPVVYLVAIEDVVRSPLIRAQVFTMLKTLRARHPEWPVVLVALYPVANWLRFRRQLAGIRAELASSQIRLHVLPIAFLTRHFYIPRLLLPLFLAQATLYLLWIALWLRPALVHCRSYPAALLGCMLKRLSGARVLFDSRASYPEEGATYQSGGKAPILDRASFEAWKTLEGSILRRADVTTAVSAPTAKILAAQYPEARDRIVVLPMCTPLAPRETLATWREQARQELGLADELVVVYAGSWFDPGPAIKLFQLLMRQLPEARLFFLLLVSRNASAGAAQSDDPLTDVVRSELGLGSNCKAIAAPQERVAYYLAAGDLAAHPERKEYASFPAKEVAYARLIAAPAGAGAAERQDQRYRYLAHTALSVKFTEYLAAELPVFVSRWHGSVAALVDEHDLGVVYDQASPETIAVWLARWRQEPELYRRRAWAFARERFAVDTVVDRYAELYGRLHGRP